MAQPAKRLTKESLRVAISKNLRAARQNHAPTLTQEGVAQFFNPPLTRAAVAQWEVGETLPDLDRLAILSKAYGVTIDALVFGEDRTDANELSPEAIRLARAWMKLDKSDKAIVSNMIASLGKP